MDTWPKSDEAGAGREPEISEAMMGVCLCLAEAIHRIDPSSAGSMNFSAGLLFNRFVDEDKPHAAELMLLFGRALLDRERFPQD